MDITKLSPSSFQFCLYKTLKQLEVPSIRNSQSGKLSDMLLHLKRVQTSLMMKLAAETSTYEQ